MTDNSCSSSGRRSFASGSNSNSNLTSNSSSDLQEDLMFWMLQKHRIDAVLQAHKDVVHALPAALLGATIPPISVLLDQCRKQYVLVVPKPGGPLNREGRGGNGWNQTTTAGCRAFVAAVSTATVKAITHVLRAIEPLLTEGERVTATEEMVKMTLDAHCPDEVAEDLLQTLVALSQRNAAKVLKAYASRMCFYCDAQNDPSMRDQVAEVGGMIRALEHFTRVLFKGYESDACAQFLYTDLSSDLSGSDDFPANLSEEELNGLLCGRKGYPHVAQLINGCVMSRLSSVRRCAYETLANVALFAKDHRGPKAYEMLLQTRLRGIEKEPHLIGILTALVWEVVFVDDDTQEERLVGRETPGSYGLLEDFFSASVEVRLIAFHSLGRLLFHAWIPPESSCDGDDRDDDGSSPSLLSSPNMASDETAHGTRLPKQNTTCAEQAMLRLSLILHEKSRRFEPRVRAAARELADGLRLRRHQAKSLIARSALVVVDHGLANGSLDELRHRFFAQKSLGGFSSRARGDSEVYCGAMSAASPIHSFPAVFKDPTHGMGDSGEEIGDLGDPLEASQEYDDEVGRSRRTGIENNSNRQKYGGKPTEISGLDTLNSRSGLPSHSRWDVESQGGVGMADAGTPKSSGGSGGMLPAGDRDAVRNAIGSRLVHYFDSGDDFFWGTERPGREDGCQDVQGSSVDPEAATDWLVSGVDTHHSLIGS